MNEIDGAKVIDVVDAATGVVNKDELLSLENYDAAEIKVKVASDELLALEKYDAAEIEVKIAREKLAQKMEALELAKSAAKAHRIEKLKEQIAAFGISRGELFPNAQKSAKKSKRTEVRAKYRGPQGEEWSGRGLTPRWLNALIAQGHTKEEFAVAS